jgi:hypothetical protein
VSRHQEIGHDDCRAAAGPRAGASPARQTVDVVEGRLRCGTPLSAASSCLQPCRPVLADARCPRFLTADTNAGIIAIKGNRIGATLRNGPSSGPQDAGPQAGPPRGASQGAFRVARRPPHPDVGPMDARRGSGRRRTLRRPALPHLGPPGPGSLGCAASEMWQPLRTTSCRQPHSRRPARRTRLPNTADRPDFREPRSVASACADPNSWPLSAIVTPGISAFVCRSTRHGRGQPRSAA